MTLISFSPLQDGVTGVNAAATNTPLNTIFNDYNGNITDANVASAAAIAFSKISGGSTTALVTWTNYTPTFTGFSISPTATGTRYVQIGKIIIVSYSCLDGTSNGTNFTVSLPITASTNSLGSYVRDFIIRAQDNSSFSFGIGEFDIGATTIALFKDVAGSNWTSTGTKGFRAVFIYEGI